MSAAAAVAVLAAGLAIVTDRGSSRPAPVLHQHVVPWADLPPGPQPESSPSYGPTADPSVRPCRATDLTASQPFPGEGAGGSWFSTFTLTNRSSAACRLTGQLDGLSGVVGGTRRDIRVRRSAAGFGSDDVAVVLEPGHAGEVQYTYYPRCDEHPPTSPHVYTQLRLTLLGGRVEVPGVRLDLQCESPDVGIMAGPLGATRAVTYTPPAWAALTATVQAPASVREGQVLRYDVTLHNATAGDIAFDSCPNLLQTLRGGPKGLWRLNCDQARPVPAHGEETFAMELAVPRGAGLGPTTLTWELAAAESSPAHADLTITS